MDATTVSWLPTAILVPLMGFALYRRVRKSFGQQPISVWRMALRMLLLLVVAALFILLLPTPAGIAAAFGGALVGGGLAFWGLSTTTYEVRAGAAFYTPNKWIGLGVTALFLGRMAARILALPSLGAGVGGDPTPLAGAHRSPFTQAIFFLMAAYYVVFYAGVMRRGRALAVAAGSTPDVRSADRSPPR